jgi:hypothetical protein
MQKKLFFYLFSAFIVFFVGCVPTKDNTEPEKLQINFDITDCTGQARYEAKMVTTDGKYSATYDQAALAAGRLEVPMGSNTYTFRIKDERGNTLSYHDTTVTTAADDRSLTLSFVVKCDGYIKGRVVDTEGLPKIGYLYYISNNFAIIDSNKTNFLIPIRYNAKTLTNPNLTIITKNHKPGDNGSSHFIPIIPFGDTLNMGDVYGEMVAKCNYTVNGDGFTNKIVALAPYDVCAESSGAAPTIDGDLWVQLLDSLSCGSSGNTVSTRLWLSGNPKATGTFPLKGGEFRFLPNGEYFADDNMTMTITKYGAIGRLIEGSFAGTASYKDGNNITHTITITNAGFKTLRKR